jgi:hypothetical protein
MRRADNHGHVEGRPASNRARAATGPEHQARVRRNERDQLALQIARGASHVSING